MCCNEFIYRLLPTVFGLRGFLINFMFIGTEEDGCCAMGIGIGNFSAEVGVP